LWRDAATIFSTMVYQPLKISIFKNGQPVSEENLPPPGSEYNQLQSWLKNHQDGWHSSFDTYAPVLLVEGTNFSANIQSSLIIINANGRQFIRKIDRTDFEFLSSP
jgi:hypothetical protein